MADKTPMHNDWLVSVTPNPRGDYKTRKGIRYNVTFHNGATAAMLPPLLEELDHLAEWLQPASGIYTGRTNEQNSPQTDAGASAAPNGANGMEVWVDGERRFYAQGAQFTVNIDRIETSTAGGKSVYKVYRVDDKWPFATVWDRDMDKIDTVIPVEQGLTTITPYPMVFAVGNKKQDSDKHWIDFVGVATASTDAPQDDLAADAQDMGGEVVEFEEGPKTLGDIPF